MQWRLGAAMGARPFASANAGVYTVWRVVMGSRICCAIGPYRPCFIRFVGRYMQGRATVSPHVNFGLQNAACASRCSDRAVVVLHVAMAGSGSPAFHRVWGPVNPGARYEIVARSFWPTKSVVDEPVLGWCGGRVACGDGGVRIARVS